VKRLAALGGLVAVGAGLGTYFALSGPWVPTVPNAQQSPILEQAKADGVIGGYRVRRFDEGAWDYEVAGGEIQFFSLGSPCGGSYTGPACIRTAPLLFVEYQRTAAEQARAILRIAEAEMPRAKIKFFEITTPGG
jgi:hypothetical protein